MPIHNLVEYNDNYSITGSFWNYYKDEVNDDANENNADNYRTNNNKAMTSKSFKYKTKIIESILDDNNTVDTEVVVSLKYWTNFWISFDLLLINCEIELDLSWSGDCIISQIYRTPDFHANANANPPNRCIPIKSTSDVAFEINMLKIMSQ